MNISSMLIRLEQGGMTQDAIAEVVGASQPSISRWSKGGSEPCYSKGKRIELLYLNSMAQINSTQTDVSNISLIA